MASLVRQGGLYYLQFFDAGRAPQRKRIPLRVRDKRTAERLRRDFESRYALKQFDPWDADLDEQATDLSTVAGAAAGFLAAKSRCREKTLSNYRWLLGLFSRHVGADRPTGQLTGGDILAFLDSTSGNARSRRTYHSALGTFVRFCVRRGALPRDISQNVILVRAPEKLSSKLITREQLDRVVQAVQLGRAPYIADVAVVTYELALRLGEVCNMRKDWVDLEGRRVTIKQSDTFLTKSGRETMKPLTVRAFTVLERLCAATPDPGGYLFRNTHGQPLTKDPTSRAFKRAARRAGLPVSICFHSLRHGGISKAVAGRASIEAVRRFASHADTKMVMRYVHLLDD